jgi:hypothetical protein
MHSMKVLTALALISFGAGAGTAVPDDPAKVTPVTVGERVSVVPEKNSPASECVG